MSLLISCTVEAEMNWIVAKRYFPLLCEASHQKSLDERTDAHQEPITITDNASKSPKPIVNLKTSTSVPSTQLTSKPTSSTTIAVQKNHNAKENVKSKSIIDEKMIFVVSVAIIIAVIAIFFIIRIIARLHSKSSANDDEGIGV